MPPRNGAQNAPNPRALLEKYNISIEGPIRQHDWPRKYAPIFSLVRDTERIRYDDYFGTDLGRDRRRLHVSQMHNQVQKLVHEAYSLRESQDNEYTWRSTTENPVLERFLTDVDCHVCNERLWISDIQAVPSCPVAAEKLQKVRAGRSLCPCDEYKRAEFKADPSTQRLFVAKADYPVVDMSMPEIQKRKLPHHKPDRVLGLRKTHEIKDLLNRNSDMMSAVIRGATDLVFPFLVLEAKPEKYTDGFESIERQTAFPIRALIKIQQALGNASTVPMDPLVWYMANRGDEWRVYGCVPEETRIRILVIWHGCVLRHDSALQLFLIVDMLCDWARDIFREQVVCCLRQRAGLASSIPLSRRSPREPLLSCGDHDNEGRLSSSDRSPGSSSDSDMTAQLEPADFMTDEVPDFTHDNMMGVEDICTATSEGAPNTEMLELSIMTDAWMEHVAIKSDKDIQIQFRSISLPESVDGLYPLIKAIGEPDIVHTARRLLALFSPKDPFIIEPRFVDLLQHAWGKPKMDVTSHGGSLFYASLSWRASFDYVDWVLTKELSCITASMTAIAALATIGQVPPDHALTVGNIGTTIRETKLIYPLRHLPLAELVHAASRNQFLYFQARAGFASPSGWVEDNEKGIFSKQFWDSLDFSPGAFSECTRNIYTNVRGHPEVLEFRDDVEIPPPLQVPNATKGRPVVLLRRPYELWESIGQVYSIFVLDRSVVQSPTEIGSAVLSLLHDEHARFYGSSEPVTVADRNLLVVLGSVLERLDPEQFVFPAL